MNTNNVQRATIVLIFCLIDIGECADNVCDDCPAYGGYLTCDPNTRCDWKLWNGYWAGNITKGSEGDVLIGLCPLGYCLYNETSEFIWIPRNATQTIGDFLCNQTNRMGVLCGQCQPGYAPAINSGGYASDCVICDAHSSKVNWIFYLLAVYVPLLVVFLAIIVFNIRLTTGPVNSFILFAQVISTTLDINQQGAAPLNIVYGAGTRTFEKSYQVPYNLFNLNIFGNLLPPFCLHRRLDAPDVITLRYAEAFFPVLVIVAIVLLVRCQSYLKVCAKLSSACESRRRKHRVGSSLVQAFAAFILLSYNRLCETTAYLLTPVAMRNPCTLQIVENRVFFQGEYLFSDTNYAVRYKLPAYLVTALLVIAPIVLLHYPLRWVERLISRVGCLRNAYPTASIAILLDTFQGCFKDNRRYFAGLYLALRLLLFFAYLLPILLTLLVQEIIIIVYIFLLAVLRPYKDNRLNYLDVAIFTNMALINTLSWYSVNVALTDMESLSICIVIESILVFLPMVYLVAYLMWYSTRRYHEGAKAKCTEWYGRCLHRGVIYRGEETSQLRTREFYTIIETELEQSRENGIVM